MDVVSYFSIETWALLSLFIGLLMLYGVWPYGVFRKLGIPGPMPLPFIGTTFWLHYGRTNFDIACFKKYGKIWGIYDGRQPILAITDPELIKIILVKESYSTFLNRGNFFPRGQLNTSIVTAEDEQWKRIRTVLSPTFTSGKLKEMLPIIQNYVKNLSVLLQKKADRDELVDVKEILGAYSMDVITSTSFGINTDSINNPKDPFVQQVKKLMTNVAPWLKPLLEKMNLSIFSNESMEFFARSITKLKEKRAQGAEKGRVDFLQLMMDSQNSLTSHEMNGVNHTYKGLTDSEILSQAIIFIFAGYETAPITYEALMQIEYLDMVLSETLRMHPGISRLQRVCKNTIELNGITIPKGMAIVIPPVILHFNPEYWPEPERFRPESRDRSSNESVMQTAFWKVKTRQIPLVFSSKGIFTRPTKPIILKIIHRV
ncbi:hypothetical protein E2320_012217 [Naja naja]|nr:hypothetical protein E2320_012217 [Naja naja]